MLATKLSRPLLNFPVKALNFRDPGNGFRPLQRFCFPPLPLCGSRSYASEVDQIGSRAVLITGCDSGFGFALAKHLHAKGLIVYAGCLQKDKGDGGSKDLDNMNSDRMRTIQLNVCDSKEVDRAVEHVNNSLEDPEK
ncbi:PREDICTED: D-beta-hydroxybutyrate dehydrogenase, mitochondrial-like, partial [Buceros rhinoceros silvestris]|uniref:D-beta-hydroxybutyrate dehydrogenase, mitochondrial-like n=1 Tax=Buceros rhinoceros silvestris TaxID=175836 RepID=UPI0005280A83